MTLQDILEELIGEDEDLTEVSPPTIRLKYPAPQEEIDEADTRQADYNIKFYSNMLRHKLKAKIPQAIAKIEGMMLDQKIEELEAVKMNTFSTDKCWSELNERIGSLKKFKTNLGVKND